jgi:hypothetical protein
MQTHICMQCICILNLQIICVYLSSIKFGQCENRGTGRRIESTYCNICLFSENCYIFKTILYMDFYFPLHIEYNCEYNFLKNTEVHVKIYICDFFGSVVILL